MGRDRYGKTRIHNNFFTVILYLDVNVILPILARLCLRWERFHFLAV